MGNGQRIAMNSNGTLQVPDDPIIPYIEGDGTGPDIWAASVRVLDAAVQKAFGGKRKIVWKEVLAGEKAFNQLKATLGEQKAWLPDETVEAFKSHLVGIKGPLTTPVGGGIRSLNVTLRQMLDLYVCLRPVHYFNGVPSPVRHPEQVEMVIFRENTEDVYAGIEFQAGSEDAEKLLRLLKENFPGPFKKIRFTDQCGLGVKPISRQGSQRLIAAAISHAIAEKRKSVTLVHKGNIMKFTEGGFREWGYQLAKERFGAVDLDGGPWQVIRAGTKPAGARGIAVANDIVVKDVIADAFLQQILTRPADYDVVATPNLNGDYISDALAAQIGGIGIAPGGNINYESGHAIFEATHGTAPKYAGQDKVNPGSVILSGEMMLRHLGWGEAADLIIRGMERAIGAKTVTYDFARLMEGATEVKCSQFGDAVIKHMS